MKIIDSKVAFNKALENQDLSGDKKSDKYAGKYMYMFSDNEVHSFKHIITREYITSKV